MRRSALAVLAIAALPLLLTGCSLTGTVVVKSPSLVEVDLTYAPPASGWPPLDNCLIEGMTIRTLDFYRSSDPAGTSVCRIVGHARVDDLQRHFGVVREVGEYVQVEFFPAGRESDEAAVFAMRQFEELDVSVTFPGDVVEHVGGRVAGRTIQFANLTELVQHRGFSASAYSSPPDDQTPFPWDAVAAGAAGVLAGVAAGAWWGVRYGRRRPPVEVVHVVHHHPPDPDTDAEEWSHD